MSKLANRLIVPLSLTLMFLGVAAWTWSLANGAKASSHREAPLVAKDPVVDTTDVYAFRSPDLTNTVTLIANWIPFEEPAGGPNFYHIPSSVRWKLNVDNTGDGNPDVVYTWSFGEVIRNPNTFLYNTGPITGTDDPDYNYRQYYTVTKTIGAQTSTVIANAIMVPDSLGPRSTPNYTTTLAPLGIVTGTDGARYFLGQRDDPFFADVGSIFDLGGLRPFNAAHLIPLSTTAGLDTLAGYNVHTTAIQVPIADVTATGCVVTNPNDTRCVIGVWATAERLANRVLGTGTSTETGSFVQVSRLGNPLVNEVVVPLGAKDLFNGTPPTGDSIFAAGVLTPELGILIPVLYPGVTVPPPPRNDLVTVFLTGIPSSVGLGFTTQQTGSASTPSEQLRLQTAITPTAGVCAGNPLGIIGGDIGGYPNGRRLEDDVVDIALRAVAGGYAFTPTFNKSPNNALGDGVNTNDRACLASFPYVPSPWSGYNTPHAVVGSTTPPVVPELSQILMFGTGLAGLGYYAYLRRRRRVGVESRG